MPEIHALVASQNRVKKHGAQRALDRFYPASAVVVDLSKESIESGVADQPLSLEETVQGVLSRIEKVRLLSGYTLFIAIEAGAHKVGDLWFESTCAGVVGNNSDPVSIGFGPGYPIPRDIARHLEEGHDLNRAVELEIGVADIGSAGGFNGWLTGGAVDRIAATSEAIVMALHGTRHL